MLNISPIVVNKFNANVISFRGEQHNNPRIECVQSPSVENIDSSKVLYYNFPLMKLTKQIDNLKQNRPNLLSHTNLDYKEWLKQFETIEEQSLAVKLLENYVYIDIDNARRAFRKLYLDLSDEIDISKTNFATLGTAKSGSFMGYLFRQANKLRSKGQVKHEFTNEHQLPNNEKFLTSTQLADVQLNKQQTLEGKDTIVIVDDILGDGDSFIEYLNKDIYDSLSQYKNIYFLTLVKDPDGEKRIKEKFPELNIQFRTAQEIQKYDSPDNRTFTSIEKMKIKHLLEKYGRMICPELVNKYSRSKLLVSFDWNTPGNTPMIFNISNSNWNGLFNRYNGLEEQDVSPEYNFYN